MLKSILTRRILIFLIASAVFLFLTKEVLAVTITIDSSPSSVSGEPFDVSVSIAGPNPGTNYLRIDLFKEGTTNYFGETFNGESWYGGSDGTHYFPVNISSEGTASATFRGRIGNPTSSEYPGPGVYKLRIRRYTSSGNPASSDQQIPVDVQITIPVSTPTPTAEPTATPEPTSAPVPTLSPKPPTSTPTKKPTPTQTPTPVPTITLTPIPTLAGEILGEEANVLTKENTPTPKILGETSRNPSFLSKILIGLGIFFLLVSVSFLLLPKILGYNGKKNAEIS